MKLRNFLSSIVTMAILAGIATAQTGIGGIVSTPQITFNKPAFETSIVNALDGNVMGWQYVLLKKGQIVSEDAGGFAQNAADNNGIPIPMTVNTPTNIGSLAKFLSGTAMLGLMQKPHGIAQYDNGLSLDQKLERKIWTVMPNAWINGMQPGIENISFRQMLQHRTGFDDQKPQVNRTVLGFLKDPDGFLPTQFDVREYSNINYVLNGYLFSAYTSSSFRQSWNNAQNMNGWSDTQTDGLYRQAMGTNMHNLMKTRIWDKMTPKISPNCDAANTLQNVAARGYSSVNDATTGQLTSSIDNQGHCGGHGGYYLSARAFANYVAHFAATDLIVNQEARDLMHTDDMAPADRLVWSFNRPSAYFGTNFNMPNVAWSNGVTGGWRTVLIKFPMDYYLVVFTNSPDLSASNLRDVSLQAFRDATEHNFD